MRYGVTRKYDNKQEYSTGKCLKMIKLMLSHSKFTVINSFVEMLIPIASPASINWDHNVK